MPQKIENKDIFSPDFLEPQKKSFKELLDLIKNIEAELKDVLKVQQEMVKTSDKKSVEGLKKRQRVIQSVNQVSKEMLKLEKQRKVASSQLQLAETQEAKAVAATRIELARKKKAVKDEILAEKGLVSEYQKQSATLNNLRKKYKDLILTQGKETRATRKLRREITTLDKRLKKVDAATGQFQRSVGNYGKAFGKVTGVLRNFGLAVGGLAVIRNITGIVRNFEQAQADLASVLGVNVEEMKALTEQARELGATTRFTAGEVSQLQKEFAKLGFDQTEIQAMTEATLQLAAATGTELPRAAEVTGATLRGFGLDASETQRVVDVMAKSFSSSSLDMEKFATAMSSVAPVAKTAGLSVEKTTALLGTLTDRGLDASTAGTGLRNIFLELSKRGLSFEEAMLQINSATDKNAASLDLFGKRGATVGTILSETAEDVSNLEGKLNDAGGAAKEMADKQLNTLNGQLDLLKSAWEGFILDLESGTGVFAGLKDVIGFVANNLKTIIKVIAAATGAFLSYRAGIIATNIATKLAAAGQKLFAIATGKATFSVKAFSTALKLNPIGLFVTVLGTAITAISLFGKGVDQAAVTQERFNKGVEKGNELGKEQVGILQEQIAEQFRLIGLQEEAGDLTSIEAKEAKLEVLMDNRMTAQRGIEESQKEINRLTKRYLEYNEQILTAKERETLSFTEQAALERERRNRASETVGILTAQQKEFKEGIKEIQKQEDALTVAKKKQIDEISEKESAALEKLAADRRKELSLYRKRLEDLQDAAIVSGFERESQQLKRKFQRDIAEIKGNSQVEIDLRKALEDALQNELEKLREKYEAKEEQLRLEDSRKKKQHREEQNDEALAIDQEYFDDIYQQQKKQLEIRAKTEEVAASEFLNIELDRLIAELELLEIYGKDTTDKLKEIADKKHQIHLANIDEIKKADEDEAKRVADELALRKKQQQDQLNALKEFAQKAIEISNAKTDKEIENIDKEIAASKTRQSELQTLAAQGNLTAEQSVSAEIKRELELERQKEALEKKKARRQIIIEGLDLLSSKIDGGEKDAVTSTLNDMTRLLGALAALPGFIDGTETTVGEALGKPQLNTGQDDYIIRVDGKEKILNPAMSARTGNMTTEEITRAAEMYSSGMFDQNVLIHPQVAALNQPFQNSNEILKKFDSLESTIRNKPILSDLKFDDLQKALVVTVEQNGDLKRAHYKLK
jgi:myosin heavy subunit